MASDACKQALKLLARSKNVLISGPPGTGKSKLLAEVALAFETGFGITPAGGPPKLNPQGGIPIPPAAGATNPDIPAPSKQAARSSGRSFTKTPSTETSCPASLRPLARRQGGQTL